MSRKAPAPHDERWLRQMATIEDRNLMSAGGLTQEIEHSPDARFDVLVYEVTTRKVAHIAGKNLMSETSEGHGFHTVEKRLSIVLGRINEHYNAVIVPAGVYKKDDVLPHELCL